jgi:hypothetical protein
MIDAAKEQTIRERVSWLLTDTCNRFLHRLRELGLVGTSRAVSDADILAARNDLHDSCVRLYGDQFVDLLGPSAEQPRPRSIIYVDVDDTLVRSVGTKRIPMVSVIEHVRRLKADGAQLYLWSAGGADYCRTTAQELGIEDCFVAFLPKPRIMIDDQEVAEWVFCTTFHPATCAGRTLQDYLTP